MPKRVDHIPVTYVWIQAYSSWLWSLDSERPSPARMMLEYMPNTMVDKANAMGFVKSYVG
jgi:hypothetical protein